MTIRIEKGQVDTQLDKVRQILAKYEAQHRRADISIYKQNNSSIRICIIDPDFQSISKEDREGEVWFALAELDDTTYGDITMLVLLTPDETKDSLLYLEFKDPSSSLL